MVVVWGEQRTLSKLKINLLANTYNCKVTVKLGQQFVAPAFSLSELANLLVFDIHGRKVNETIETYTVFLEVFWGNQWVNIATLNFTQGHKLFTLRAGPKTGLLVDRLWRKMVMLRSIRMRGTKTLVLFNMVAEVFNTLLAAFFLQLFAALSIDSS